jgi:pSer/pThr/pTyr-binding forkhead associated (FHA) protein
MPPDDSSLVIHEGAGAGSEHPLSGQLILGREHPTADLVIPDPGVSRRHARVLPGNGTVIVEDLGSSNGTYVNGHRITGPVELVSGDHLQLGDTVIGLRHTAATARPRGPSPRRLAPPPHQAGNIPALAALFLGPLSILLVFLSTGGFFVALPCAIAAIVLGTIGIRNADRRRLGHRVPARIGRITGWVGTALSILAVVVFVVVATALHTTEASVSGLVDRIQREIDKVDVNAPDVNTPEVPGRSDGSSSGGTPAPGQ